MKVTYMCVEALSAKLCRKKKGFIRCGLKNRGVIQCVKFLFHLRICHFYFKMAMTLYFVSPKMRVNRQKICMKNKFFIKVGKLSHWM